MTQNFSVMYIAALKHLSNCRSVIKIKQYSGFINDFWNLKAYPIKAINEIHAKSVPTEFILSPSLPPFGNTYRAAARVSFFLSYLFHFTLINVRESTDAGIPLGVYKNFPFFPHICYSLHQFQSHLRQIFFSHLQSRCTHDT